MSERRAPDQCPNRNIDPPQQVARTPAHSVERRRRSPRPATRRSTPSADQTVQMPSSADGERNHRTCRQGHAEIAADGRGLPDLERGEEGAAALVDQRGREPVGWAGQAHRAARWCRWLRCEMALGDRQRRPFQIGEIDQPRQVDLRLRERQVPPASQASPGVQTGRCARVCGCATSVMVFRSMAAPTLPPTDKSYGKVLQDQRQVATTSRSDIPRAGLRLAGLSLAM